MIFQCKMCGGDLRINTESSTGICEYCGTKMTLPRVDDERILNLFNRANHYRMKSDFDNAAVSYQNILAEDHENAEAYWGLCLCKFGIEYVEDPRTEKRLPTCHRTRFQSIFKEEDFKKAIQYADSDARGLYYQEADAIDAIQKKILAISSREELFDVFICYKETDFYGERTVDSVMAQEIYDVLTEKGMRVFFSRITLEDKIGEEYEPYIFAALNSAKVMLLIATNAEHINAVWVKNEWSRFLHMISEGEKKTIIPVYKLMSPYDMPEALSNIQSVNMEKLGALQDLIRGVEKLLDKSIRNTRPQISSETMPHVPAGIFHDIAPLLKRAHMFLADESWEKANEYAERVLDMEPENGEAYLIKLLARVKVTGMNHLERRRKSVAEYPEYKKILKYADEELLKQLKTIEKNITREKDQQQREREEETVRKCKLKIERLNMEIDNLKKDIGMLNIDIGELTKSENEAVEKLNNCMTVIKLENTEYSRKRNYTVNTMAIICSIIGLIGVYLSTEMNTKFDLFVSLLITGGLVSAICYTINQTYLKNLKSKHTFIMTELAEEKELHHQELTQLQQDLTQKRERRKKQRHHLREKKCELQQWEKTCRALI